MSYSTSLLIPIGRYRKTLRFTRLGKRLSFSVSITQSIWAEFNSANLRNG